MLPMVCPCGEILANKQLYYEKKMKEVCEELSVDFDMVSRGLSDNESEFKLRRCEIINKLCKRYCCKQLMMNYVNVVNLIKG